MSTEPTSPDEERELCNFQREETLARLEELLRAPGGAPKVVALRGGPGSGRGYLLEAVARRAQRRGERVLCAVLDLDGFEPAAGRLLPFAEHRLARAGVDKTGPLAQAVTALAGRLSVSAFGAGALSLALGERDPRAALPALLGGEALPGPETTGDEQIFELLLERLVGAGALIVHVPQPATLPLVLWRALVRAARREPRLVVVASAPEERTVDLPFAPEALVLDLRPLLPGEVTELLDRNLPGPGLPRELGVALGRATSGNPGRLALKLRALLDSGLLEEAQDGWRLARPAGSPEVAALVAAPLAAPLEELLRGHADGPALRTFLGLGALCGPHVPVDAVIDAMGAPKDVRERVVELIDEHLLADGLGFFQDLEYRHPAFAPFRTPVYRFTSALHRTVLLALLAPDMPADTPRKLVEFLARRLPPVTLGAALLHLELVDLAGDARLGDSFRRHVAWWIGRGESQALTDALDELAGAGKLARASLLDTAAGARAWPPHRRLALLAAYARGSGGVPAEEAGRFHLERAALLFEDRQPEAALAEAGLAAQVHAGRDPVGHAAAMRAQARALLELGRPAESLALARAAVAGLRAAGGGDHVALGEALLMQAMALPFAEHLPVLAEAEKELRHEPVRSDRLALVLEAAGTAELELGRAAEAEAHLREALGEHQRGAQQGRLDPARLAETGYQLGRALLRLERPADAIEIFKQAFGIARQGDPSGRLDHDRLGRILYGAGTAQLRGGRLQEGAQALAGAVESLRAGDLAGRVNALVLSAAADRLAWCLLRARAPAEAAKAAAMAAEVLAGFEVPRARAARARALARLSVARARLGEAEAARAGCAEVRALRATLSAARPATPRSRP